ncbi:MAG: hypothetical protein JW810_03085 [Sedimentisphaerales bacterium]|nr:hypothetical protein [Sedimentisphaerales bacterium]
MGNDQADYLEWTELVALPDPLGVAGPFAGVHLDPDDPDNEVLIVAGGANFPVADGQLLWDVPKRYHDRAWVLIRKTGDDGTRRYAWLSDYRIARPRAYGACASSPHGVVCIGGTDGERAYADVFILSWDAAGRQLRQTPLPPLPEPSHGGQAVIIDNILYVVGGMSGLRLDSATRNMWSLDLSRYGDDSRKEDFRWKKVLPWPGPARAMAVVVGQHNGFDPCLYVMSGRRQPAPGEDDPRAIAVSKDETVIALRDVYEFCPARYDASAYHPDTGDYHGTGRRKQPWRRRKDAPFSFMAGSGAPVGQSHIFILAGADGSHLREVFEHRRITMDQYDHPGFPRRSLAYHTITDTWIEAGATPANQVTTPAVSWGDDIFIVSGEIRPRVRTARAWRIHPVTRSRAFGGLNVTVLAAYLLAMVAVGAYFAKKNKTTDDYFRGGQKIPWWVAGCSIFATMLSSITYMAIPAKAFAQNWVYLIGNLMILAVAPIAIYLVLPFFRQIDATSAYEYLQKRFNMPVRLFGSASFTVFHLFRMGIVMSLAALALSTIADFSPLLKGIGLGGIPNANTATCVLIMGILSILYSTLGGVEAVVWTDTLQTFVLLGGALLCFALMMFGIEGGFLGFVGTAAADGKFHLANLHGDPTSASLALWVVILGAFGQNVSSYTADQAVVQRYMTTADSRRAAGAIWTNAWLCLPATLLFFAVGSGLYAFYKSHPEKLDPTFMTDQIFPLFISREVPVGIAGLLVAGIFAAAQSTISTSMNSTATAVVTDFLRPFHVLKTERGYLNAARGVTLAFGVVGTLLGLLFVNPDIKSLFDQFIKVIGLFMGVLCGLFGLGMLTRRANGWGALIGASAGAAIMGLMPVVTNINGYLYAFIGITTCFIVGYAASWLIPAETHDLNGLTVYTVRNANG